MTLIGTLLRFQYPTVTIGCNVCLQPVTYVFDPGYPDTRWEPGMPPSWYEAQMNDDPHTCSNVLTDAMIAGIDEALYNSIEYRTYEYEESRV